MATTADRLKEIMRERHLKQIDIIRMVEPYCEQYKLKLSKSDMSQFVSGKVTPGQWKISLLSKALGVSPAWLMGEDVPMNYGIDLPPEIRKIKDISPHRVPLLGNVAAGEPILAEESYEMYIDAPNKADYALTIQGDSMNPTYLEGDVVYIREQPDINYDGQVAVVLFDDSATVKHVYKQENGLLLTSDNPSWSPMLKLYADYDYIRILGIICGYTRMYKEK